ncbi:hypothetical protein LT493_18285 [Streptomyces tricolor]|nr:hypothetical protein [Streptomyces tricolor]
MLKARTPVTGTRMAVSGRRGRPHRDDHGGRPPRSPARADDGQCTLPRRSRTPARPWALQRVNLDEL